MPRIPPVGRFDALLREHGVGRERVLGSQAWRAFKAYGREVFGEPGVSLLFQAGTRDFSGCPRFYFHPVCQFEIVDEDGQYLCLEQLHCELSCAPSAALDGAEAELWSEDYPTADAYFAAAELLPAFALASRRDDYVLQVRHEQV